MDNILEQKPFTLDLAIHYADEMANKYNKIYCVISNKKENKGYEIVGIRYCKQYIHRYNVHHIAMKYIINLI